MAQTLDEIVEEIGISREEAKHLYDEYKSGKSGFDNKNKKIKKVSKKCWQLLQSMIIYISLSRKTSGQQNKRKRLREAW